MIERSTIDFIRDLTRNNNRDWFAQHRERYDAALANARAFAEGLVAEMNRADDIDGHRMYRIYRDVRFSKDKTPYNPRFGMSLNRRKPHLRGGYFVDIEPEQTRVVVGFWGPNKTDLALIRDHIGTDPERFRAAANAPQIQDTFGPMTGEALKTAPKGYRRDHPAIDLLRHKQFLFRTAFSTDETLEPDFLQQVVFTLLAVRPFFDYMSEILASDANGERLY